MHAISFIQDLAVIMLVAGVVTILFHRFKQPVVLGYIVAGFIIGPHTPPFGLIHDEDTIKTLAELGVIFLMFCLGLEFSLRKLFKVGATAFIAAFLEIVLMIWIGFEIGRWFGWSTMDSLFLGAILAISSTTIIVKALNDLKMKNERFAQLIFGCTDRRRHPWHRHHRVALGHRRQWHCELRRGVFHRWQAVAVHDRCAGHRHPPGAAPVGVRGPFRKQ
ncbi:UNVERIFIED_ORG: Kef-type K+ transport system membrane component KefB [Pseudomonas vranovensis]|nr:Kef-type K+ transport system membrane component KefB [Pseudomonas vranovensis]